MENDEKKTVREASLDVKFWTVSVFFIELCSNNAVSDPYKPPIFGAMNFDNPLSLKS